MAPKKNKKPKSKKVWTQWPPSYLFVFTVTCLLIVMVALLYGKHTSKFFDMEYPNEMGTFGDQFGVLSACFSGFAFAGMIITLMMQQKELKMQRRAVRKNGKELKMQRFDSGLMTRINLFLDRYDKLDYMYRDYNAIKGIINGYINLKKDTKDKNLHFLYSNYVKTVKAHIINSYQTYTFESFDTYCSRYIHSFNSKQNKDFKFNYEQLCDDFILVIKMIYSEYSVACNLYVSIFEHILNSKISNQNMHDKFCLAGGIVHAYFHEIFFWGAQIANKSRVLYEVYSKYVFYNINYEEFYNTEFGKLLKQKLDSFSV